MTELRTLERESLEAFVLSCSEHFGGHVLDYGCGDQRYRPIIEAAGGEYVGYDRAAFPGNVSGEDLGPSHWPPSGPWDAILSTQVFQFVPNVLPELRTMQWLLRAGRYAGRNTGGCLIATYTTHWPEVEEGDLHRFTKAGMTRLLVDAGFVIERHERRAEIVWNGETFALGYGCVARA